MNGGRHQRIGVHSKLMITCRRFQAFEKEQVILRVDERGLVVEAAENHMLRLFRYIKTGEASHTQIPCDRDWSIPARTKSDRQKGTFGRTQANNPRAF